MFNAHIVVFGFLCTEKCALLTIALWFTGWSCSIDTVHSKYCNTELHTSRKCHCSVGVTSGDVEVDTVIRGVDESDHILHCTVTHTPANQ